LPNWHGPENLDVGDMTHPVVGCMACQFDRQVYSIEIKLV
jgi:hypothetical protein